jgi:cytochrome c peroxidase
MKYKRIRASAATFALMLTFMLSCGAAAPLAEPIQPLPLTNNEDPARAALGRRLFNDGRLSANNRLACSSCHDLAKGGADGLVRSVGFDGKLTQVNAPTVLNAALNFKQYWNGRVDTLEMQIETVVKNPVVMGSSWSDVVRKIAQDASYQEAFAHSYKDAVTEENIVNAIASYERTLITPNSRFDRYLRGENNAISEEEKAGYAKFKQSGCIACHQGVNVGGNMFETFGVMGDYFKNRGNPTAADMGRYLVTQEAGDEHVFKVPSLRNVALTSPYFHDGSAKTLDAAVDVMFKYQLGRIASKEDKVSIILFLNTLTGDFKPAS